MKIWLKFVCLSAGCFPLLTIYAQKLPDSLKNYAIPEIKIIERHYANEVRSGAPLQVLSSEELKALNVMQVSDAVKHFAGVTVKDYGGIGGLKTISLRSLGAQHTTIGYDGVTITDCQTGQIDIGRFSLNNVDRLMLNNGQNDQIFQSARYFASAGILNIFTLTPHFSEEKSSNFRVACKTGSWGLVNPSFYWEQRLSGKWSLTADAEWLSSKGDYPYTLYYGGENDRKSREERKNSSVRNLRTEISLFGNFSDTEQLRLRAYYYQSSRGLPSATTFYYTDEAQHLWDKNVFVQGSYKKEFNDRWAVKVSGKWNWNYQRYLDEDYKGSVGKLENSYYQQEYYLSAVALYRVTDNLSFSLATDGSINKLHADLVDFASPVRYSWLTALAGKYVTNRFTLSASVLSTIIDENVRRGSSAGTHRRLSPYVSMSFKPFRQEEFRIRAFYKKIFRMPTFNDLYYGQTGNRDLEPEYVTQYNLGMAYAKNMSGFLSYLSLTADGYINRIDDKIMAIPTRNLFIWSMVNLGKVDIKGLDLTSNIGLSLGKGFGLTLTGNYTFQKALDVTDPNPETVAGKTYRNQIAYTPSSSGSASAVLETPYVDFSYSMLFSGERYIAGENIDRNLLDGYTDHSLSVSKDFCWKTTSCAVNAELLNLMNKNYEIVKNFPMPGRSFRITLTFKY